MSTFYLVRHAHADWSPDEARPLSRQGRRDAQRVADILQAYPICHIASSPARRAQQTIAPLAQRLGLPMTTLPALRERCLSGSAVPDFYAAIARTWEDFTFAHPGGESNAAAQARIVTLMKAWQVRYPYEHIVFSTHGNVLALLLNHVNAVVEFTFWQALTMPDIYQLVLGQDGRSEMRRLWKPSGDR